MALKLNLSKVKNVAVLALLFLAAMNFQAKFFYFVFLSLFVVVVVQRRIKADFISLIYMMLSVVMALYNAHEGVLSMLRCLAPFFFYLVGMNMVDDIPKTIAKEQETDFAQKQGYTILVVISLGSFSHYAMNFFYNFGSTIGRNTNDIWTRVPMAATGQNALACLMLGLATAMIFLPIKKWHRYAAVAAIVMMLAYNLVLAGRTLIVILLVLLLIGLFYPKAKVKNAPKKTKTIVEIVLFVLAILVIYLMNIGGIRDYVENSLLFNRFGGSLDSFANNSERSNTRLAFLSEMLNYPFGGLHLREKYGYAHDLLLDGYDEYGILGFVLLIAVLVTGIFQLCINHRCTAYTKEFKLALLLIYFAILLEFMVEPILAGMPWLFSCYCLINGCVTGMNRVNKEYSTSR